MASHSIVSLQWALLRKRSLITVSRSECRVLLPVSPFERLFQHRQGSVQFISRDLHLTFPQDVLDGYNGTVFAYGQTGSGKTFTMMVGAVSLFDYISRSISLHRVRILTRRISRESSLESPNKSSSPSSRANRTSSILSRFHTWKSTWKRFGIC